MAGMGPPPKPNARRRNASPSTLRLPAEGRRGRTPAWPLPAYACPFPEVTKAVRARELVLWRELWKKPQALAWEKLGMHAEVGLYCRFRSLSERGDMKAASEARQMGDRLGMTPMSLLRLRWEIVSDEVAQQRADRAASKKASSRTGTRRLRAVDGS